MSLARDEEEARQFRETWRSELKETCAAVVKFHLSRLSEDLPVDLADELLREGGEERVGTLGRVSRTLTSIIRSTKDLLDEEAEREDGSVPAESRLGLASSSSKDKDRSAELPDLHHPVPSRPLTRARAKDLAANTKRL